MLPSSSSDLYTDTSATSNDQSRNSATAASPTGTAQTYFAGARNTNANHSIFNNVRGNQVHNTSVTNVPESQDEKILSTLDAVYRGGHYVPPCMKGTREHVFGEIYKWLDNEVDERNVLWLSGSPGAGKSTIASSIVSRLTECRRLGSSFFFRRGDVALSDPTALWRTVAHDLATRDHNFAQVLIKTLKEGTVDLWRPDIELHFKLLVQNPLQKSFDSSTPPVIVIDALDECDSDGSQEAQRVILLDTLVQWSRLPKAFKLIVTGRNDRMSKSFRAVCKHIVLPSGDGVDTKANADIRRFFKQQFDELGSISSPKWPGEQVLDDLTVRAAGLLIWAQVVVTFVKRGLPDRNLALVLRGDLGKGDDLTKLYQQILEFSFRDIEESMLEVAKLVISTILLAEIPLPRSDLYLLTSETQPSVDAILDKLSSVITTGSPDERLRFMHLSFREFLCDSQAARCLKAFFINRERESQKLAMSCFQQMKMLKFNICDLETSCFRNTLVRNSEEPITEKISGALSYSCRFWAVHLHDTGFNQNGRDILLQEVKDFLYQRFLFWLEVMSFVGEIPATNVRLLEAALWIEEFDEDLSAFAKDASQFIVDFKVPISTSVPHIYLSALPFSPSESLVRKRYLPHFPNTISVVSGLDENWPAIANTYQDYAINCIAFSPDGKRVVSGSKKTIFLWDAETGHLTAEPFTGHTFRVNSVEFSPDSKRIVSGSDDMTIRVWDVDTGKLIADPFCGHTAWVNSVGFSPNGKWIISGSGDRTIRVWDAETGQPVAGPFEGHTKAVISVGFSPDSKRIVSGSTDKTIRVWDMQTGLPIAKPFISYTSWINSVVFSPNGKRIASGSSDGKICMWDVETGQLTMNPVGGHTSWVNSVKFSTDGKRIVSGSHDYTICVWDAETGQLIAGPFTGHTHRVHSVAFSPDGTRVVSGSEDTTIRVWDVEIFQNLSPQVKSHTDKTLAIGGIMFRPECRGWLGSHRSLSGNLVLWAPWANQSGIGGIETVVIFGRTTIRLDLSRFCWGESWTECYSPLEDTSHDRVDLSLTQIHSSSASAARHADTRIFSDQSAPTLDPIPDPGNGSGLSHAIPTGPPKITAAADDVNSDKPPSDHPGVVPESDQSSSYIRHLQNAIVIAVPLITFYYFYSIRHRT